MKTALRMIGLAAAFLLLHNATCTPQQQDDTFAIVCAGVSTADLGFQIYADSGRVSADVIKNEALAVTGAQAICNGPRPSNVSTAIAALNRALQSIADATRQARLQVGKS